MVISCAGASLLVGCGGGGAHRSATTHDRGAEGGAQALVSDRTDLRSPDVDGRMDSPSGTLFACPRATRLHVSFDPRGTVALVGAGRPLVYGAVRTRAVNRGCAARGHLSGVPKGVLQERTAPATLTCAVRGSARFVVRPIDGGSRAVGSVIAVLAPNLHSVVISAVLEPTGSRLYYGRACRTRYAGSDAPGWRRARRVGHRR